MSRCLRRCGRIAIGVAVVAVATTAAGAAAPRTAVDDSDPCRTAAQELLQALNADPDRDTADAVTGLQEQVERSCSPQEAAEMSALVEEWSASLTGTGSAVLIDTTTTSPD